MKLRILLSYHYNKDTDLDAFAEKFDDAPDIFIDSGGFSAMTQGATINIKEYAEFLRRYAHRITVYANLDEIGNAQKTLGNQKRLEDAGLRPIPVFHTAEDFSYLERYVEAYPYIALGGMVPYMTQWKKLMPWIIKCFSIAGKRSMFHGFGCTTWEIARRVPWYSIDSSTWCVSFKFGEVPLFDWKNGRFVRAKLGDVPGCKALRHLFDIHKFDWHDFADRSRNSRAHNAGVSAVAFTIAERYLRKVHGDLRLPSKQPGANVYLADSGGDGILASQMLKKMSNDGGARVYLANQNFAAFYDAGAAVKDKS